MPTRERKSGGTSEILAEIFPVRKGVYEKLLTNPDEKVEER